MRGTPYLMLNFNYEYLCVDEYFLKYFFYSILNMFFINNLFEIVVNVAFNFLLITFQHINSKSNLFKPCGF